jgi:magnesium transporter
MTELREYSQHTDNIKEIINKIQYLLKNITLENKVSSLQNLAPPELDDLQDALPGDPQLEGFVQKINALENADLAFILTALPIEQRWIVWNSIRVKHGGKILIELIDSVRENLITRMSHEELCNTAEQLDISEIALLAPHLPQLVMRDVFKSLSIENREKLHVALSFQAGTVGALMDFNILTIRQDVTLETAARYLRQVDFLPDQSDQLFVIDRDGVFKGLLPLTTLLATELKINVSAVINTNCITLHPDDKAEQAAQAFERCRLISAPVIDEEGKLLGRVTVNAVINFNRTKSKSALLDLAGLHEEEDFFSSVWKSAKNRWAWLAINLCGAFFVSRVIGGFEDTIENFVALAALMPIIASIAINSGNQTMTLITRSLVFDPINSKISHRLLIKELALSLLNGMVWGVIAGGFAYLLYKSAPLALVTTGAILLSLLLGALVGFLIPTTLQKLGRDPTFSSKVLLSVITTSGSLFIFLGLATLFLVN